MDVKREYTPLVKAIVAEISDKHSIRDVRSAQSLSELGLDDRRIAEVVIRLYRAASESSAVSFPEFEQQVTLTANSRIGDIAGRLAQAYPQSSPNWTIQLPASYGDDPTLPIGLVGAAVQTAIAQQSRKHSISEIKKQATLAQLGLGDLDIAEIKTGVYRMLSGEKACPSFERYFQGADIRRSSTVEDAVHRSYAAFGDAWRIDTDEAEPEDPTEVIG